MRYFKRKISRKGAQVRYAWEPPASVERLGFRFTSLGTDYDTAIARAYGLNERLEKARLEDTVQTLRMPTDHSIAGLVAAYRASSHWLGLAPKTRKGYIRHLDWLAQVFGDLEPASFTPAMAHALLEQGRDRPHEANARIRTLRALWSWGRRTGRCSENPFSAPRLIRTQSRDQIFTDNQIEQFLTACRIPGIKLAFEVAIWTAQRQADILAMRWSDIQDDRLACVQQKTGARVSIPVAEPLGKSLEQAMEGIPTNDLHVILRPDGEPYKADHFRHQWREEMRHAGLPDDLNFQDTRRTSMLRLALIGCTVPEIAAISGHSILSAERIMKVYLPRHGGLAERAIARWKGHAGQVIPG